MFLSCQMLISKRYFFDLCLPRILLILLTLIHPSLASADFQQGLDAYQDGDYSAALREWEPLAEDGSAGAQFNLGMMYYRGQGVPQDYKTAIKWYSLVAEQGDAAAQFNMGVMFYNGRGVPQDYVRAYMWLNIAASSGGGSGARDSVAQKMTPLQIKEAKSLSSKWLAKRHN